MPTVAFIYWLYFVNYARIKMSPYLWGTSVAIEQCNNNSVCIVAAQGEHLCSDGYTV